MSRPDSNPARTAAVLRDLTARFRAAGHTAIALDELDRAINQLETNGWVNPQPQREPYTPPQPNGNGNHP